MATYISDAAAATAQAKSGVRDSIKVPFTVSGALAVASGDTIELAKVSQGHKIVGYYIESATNLDSHATGAVVSDLKYLDGASGATAKTLVTGTALGRGAAFGADANTAGGAISNFGARKSNGAAVTTSPGAFLAGGIPSDTFTADGKVYLSVTATPTTGVTNWKLVGYVEVQPV